MSNPQNIVKTSDSPSAKLLEVDAQLALQEEELLAQLQSIQSKRQSLKTVIDMFATVDTEAAAPIESAAHSPVAESSKEPETVVDDTLVPPLLSSSSADTESGTDEVVSDTQPHSTGSTVFSNRNNKTQKLTHTATSKKSLKWQDYVRAEFSHTSLPSAVFAVMQRQSERVFDIAAIMNAIFVDELPAEVRTKARRQVTNILSAGAMNNKFDRGQIGQYSLSKTAVKARA